MKYFGQILLFVLAVAVLLGLVYQYQFGENGLVDYQRLQQEIMEQQQINEQQKIENEVLKADVSDLKNGLEAVEGHARIDLGLIKPHETFVQISTAPIVYSQYSDTTDNPDDVIEEVP